MKKTCLLVCITILLFSDLFAQSSEGYVQKWAFEINALWPVFPGNIYSARVMRQLYSTDNTSGEAYLGFAHRPYEFREDEGNFSNSAVVFGYR